MLASPDPAVNDLESIDFDDESEDPGEGDEVAAEPDADGDFDADP